LKFFLEIFQLLNFAPDQGSAHRLPLKDPGPLLLNATIKIRLTSNGRKDRKGWDGKAEETREKIGGQKEGRDESK